MMDWRSTYFDLVREIDILEMRVRDLEFQFTISHNRLLRGTMPSDGHSVYVPLDIALEMHSKSQDALLSANAILEHKKKTKRDIEDRMNAFEGLTYQLLYMRDIQVLSLQEIADNLGYSLDWAKQVSRKYERVKKAN